MRTQVCVFVDPSMDCRASGDAGRLRQILLNVLSNAVKFSHSGDILLHVSVIEDAQADQGALSPGLPGTTAIAARTFRFSCWDNGIGISAEGIQKIFKRFSQVDSSKTRSYGGSGLGLAISKQLAELMGGTMGVQSQAGKGSEFWFTASMLGWSGVPGSFAGQATGSKNQLDCETSSWEFGEQVGVLPWMMRVSPCCVHNGKRPSGCSDMVMCHSDALLSCVYRRKRRAIIYIM